MAVVRLNPTAGNNSDKQDAATATKKRGSSGSVAVHTSDLAQCDVLDVRDVQAFAVKPPASVTALTVHACETHDGTFVLVQDVGTAGVVSVTASRWQMLDASKLAPYGFFKFLSTGAAGTVQVVGKS